VLFVSMACEVWLSMIVICIVHGEFFWLELLVAIGMELTELC
jgi:hypothetical protein